MVPSGVVAVSAVVGPLRIVAAIVVVWLTFEIAVLPGILVGPLETAVVIAFGASNLGHPRYFAFPNVCSVPRCSSFVGLVGEVFAGSSMDVLPNDDLGSHSSNLTVPFHKRMGPFDSRPNLSHSSVSDTNALPTDATTNHGRKRCPHLRQGQHRHQSQVSLPSLEVWQIRWVEEKC